MPNQFTNPWTDSEIEFLRTNYSKHDVAWLVQKLGRSESSIWYKASSLGLKAFPERKYDLSETEKAYIAGIIDGEGSILLAKKERGFVPVVIVTNTSEILIDFLEKKIGGRIRTKAQGMGSKPIWRLVVANRPSVYPLLKLLLPYLVVKRERAGLIIQWCEKRHTSRQPLTEEEKTFADKCRQ